MDAKASIRDYWQGESHIYDKNRLHIYRSEEEKSAYKKALEKALQKKALCILDVGTGTGFLALLLSEMGHEVTGLDLTEGMLREARNKAQEFRLSIKFELGDAEALPFDDESFDAVVCRHLLWTLPDPPKALKEWLRVTRRGGRIVAIEGKWRDSSLVGHFQRLSRQLAVLVHDRANPWRSGYRKEINEMLPLRDGVTPEKAADLFEQAGLGNISLQILQGIREVQKKGLPVLYKAAYSYPMFLIRGERLES